MKKIVPKILFCLVAFTAENQETTLISTPFKSVFELYRLCGEVHKDFSDIYQVPLKSTTLNANKLDISCSHPSQVALAG